jgi:Domain of unknown function (DUF4145)
MQSLNFEILRTHYPQLADLGGFAEQYVYSDPEGAAAKLRKFGEALARAIYARSKLLRPSYTQYDLLRTSTFKLIVPEEIRGKFDSVRITGNDGTHPEGRVTEDDALSRLKDAHDLGKWWMVLAFRSDIDSLPVFTTPSRRLALPPEVQDRLNEQERLLEKTLADLEHSRKQYHEVPQDDTQLKALRKKGTESAHLSRLMPDQSGLARGVRLFRYLAAQANRGKPVGISYGDFIAFLHGKGSFQEAVGRDYLPGDSGAVIELAWSITRANGGRITLAADGRTIQSGMDSFIWQSRPPHKRAEAVFDNPKCTLPYSPTDWKAVFPDGQRRLVKPGILAIEP